MDESFGVYMFYEECHIDSSSSVSKGKLNVEECWRGVKVWSGN